MMGGFAPEWTSRLAPEEGIKLSGVAFATMYGGLAEHDGPA